MASLVFFIYFTFYVKAGFHMIADDRRRSQRELFPYNRSQSQTIAEPTVAYISVSGSVRKIAANNMADVEEETLLQANLFLLLVLKSFFSSSKPFSFCL